jgi:hypothetical protein
MFEALRRQGFDIVFQAHAEAILAGDFPDAAHELEEVLSTTSLPVDELIAGGGGEAGVTQRMRRALAGLGWRKTHFTVVKTVNGRPLQSQSHEVDHVRRYGEGDAEGSIALEIEWNNKDPFFDRDLENFKRLHADGAISLGVIVTRGAGLQAAMVDLIQRRLVERGVAGFDDLAAWRYRPTERQRKAIGERAAHMPFVRAFAELFVADKFGEATTHWRKLEDRVDRGVGNPCPLLLLGLPAAIVTFEG